MRHCVSRHLPGDEEDRKPQMRLLFQRGLEKRMMWHSGEPYEPPEGLQVYSPTASAAKEPSIGLSGEFRNGPMGEQGRHGILEYPDLAKGLKKNCSQPFNPEGGPQKCGRRGPPHPPNPSAPGPSSGSWEGHQAASIRLSNSVLAWMPLGQPHSIPP